MKTICRVVLLAICLSVILPGAARAQQVLTQGQISFINLSLDASAPTNPHFVVNLYNGTLDQTIDPIFNSGINRWVFDHGSGARFLVQNPHLYTRPGGGAWNFIGVGPNDLFRATPQNGNPDDYLILSVSTIDFPSGFFVNDQVTVTLLSTSATLPGHFSMYTNDDPFNDATGNLDTVYLSTLNNLNSFTRLAGTENNYNLAFSNAGTYQLDFQFSGTLRPQFGGGQVLSDIYRYTFVVAAIPEPMTVALIGMTVLMTAGGVIHHRRRKRRLAEAVL